jgi:DNA repair protein SbcC/Rad50
MPSRAGADGLGAFSYYDHVYLPESQKELTWTHRGRRYKSQLVFRLNGKRRTEAFLFEQAGGVLKPVALADGTVCDGRVDMYERAVRELLGAPETFFTSVFSAQGKRPLSAYRNGEIKSLLADLLGLDPIREQGERAAQTLRLLKNGLALIRQEQAVAAAELGRLARELTASGDTETAVAQASATKAAAGLALDAARVNEAAVATQAQAAAGNEKRRGELTAERNHAITSTSAALRRIDEEAARTEARARALAQRIATRRRQHDELRTRLSSQRNAHVQACMAAGRVAWATRRLGLAERVAQWRGERAEAAQSLAYRADQLRGRQRLLSHQIVGIEREAGQVSLRHADLTRRFGLVAQVPCAGTDLQGRCNLLGDAREAQALLPSVGAQIAALRERQRVAEVDRISVAEQLVPLADATQRRNAADHRFAAAQSRASKLARLAARAGEIVQSQAALAAVESELAQLPQSAPTQTDDEATERQEIAAACDRLIAERNRLTVEQDAETRRVDAALAALPAPFDMDRLDQAKQATADAQARLRTAEQAHLAAIRRHEQSRAICSQHARTQAEKASREARCTEVEAELSGWTLLAKCLSNDGVIALDIDDAGPTLAALTNDLLLACYGPRFTLEIRTQITTAKGELREGFDVIVHDGQTGEAKSVSLLSGGERVFVNECLTRAIALYLAGNAGREYGTLFCDEADGPLDPQRKRMFMAMKREVLRLGGYEREFFVSQTPELTAMADQVIDLDALAMTRHEVV